MNPEIAHSIDKEKENQNINPFVIVKPDGGRYLKELEETLTEKQISIMDIYHIEDWETVARSLYREQLETSSRSFCVGFETHVWLCQYLFGNQGLLLLLDTESNEFNLDSKVQTVYEAREYFRKNFFASNGTFTIAVNLDKFEDKTFKGSGKKRGTLGIFESNSFDPLIEEGGSEGTWYRNYFKYIHAPGNTEELSFQFRTLVDLGIIREENRIMKEEWDLLKFLRCLTPPSKFITAFKKTPI